MVGATYHEEGFGDSVFGEEEDVDAVDTKHPYGGGSDKRSSSVEFEKSRRVGESEGDDENSKLAMTIREDTNIAKRAQKDRANPERTESGCFFCPRLPSYASDRRRNTTMEKKR